MEHTRVTEQPHLESAPAIDAGIVASGPMRDLLEDAARVASSRIPVILRGETGTGKDVLARWIHAHSRRRARRMVRVNCAAIPKDLIESTWFGHERGAFTGALAQRAGIFEAGDGGTVFLDEIGELSPAAQAALLRVLESGSFSRVGSSREVAVDVRIIAATHRNLEAMARAGTFRADLYYRLAAVMLEIPPLRARPAEIEPLSRRFLSLANATHGRAVENLSADALALLCAHTWPGNVRELRNAIERAVVMARGPLITPDDLPRRLRDASPLPLPAASDGPVRCDLRHYEAAKLRAALVAANWNRAQAAQHLSLPVRTLSYRMKVLGLRKPTL